MFSKKYLFTSVLLTSVFVISNSNSAAADDNIMCKNSAYTCTTDGYKGKSPVYPGYATEPAKDPSNEFYHNCVTYVGYKLGIYKAYHVKFGAFHNAGTWATQARKSEYARLGVSVSKVPHVNDVAEWNFGHIAWVESVYTSAKNKLTIIVTEDMWGKQLTRKIELVEGDTGGEDNGWPDNFITFPTTLPNSSGGSSGGSGSGGSDDGDSGDSDGGSSGGQPAGRGKWGALPIEAVAPTPDENY